MRSKETHLHVQSWQAVVADGDAQKSICIQTPFVLVGKHKDCQIQVAPKLPKRIDLFPFAPSKVNIGGLSISTSLPTPVTGPAETLAQTVRRHSTDEIDLAVRLSKLGQNKPLSWRSIGLTGLALVALFACVFALYHVIAGLLGQW